MVRKINSKVLIAFLLVLLLGVLSALTVFGGGAGSSDGSSEGKGDGVPNFVASADYGFRAYFAIVSPEVEPHANILTVNDNDTINLLDNVSLALSEYRSAWCATSLSGDTPAGVNVGWDPSVLYEVPTLHVSNDGDDSKDSYTLNGVVHSGNWVSGINEFLRIAKENSNAKFGITDVDAVDKAFADTCAWARNNGAPSWVDVETEGLVLVCEPVVKLMRGDVVEFWSYQDYIAVNGVSEKFHIILNNSGEGDTFVKYLGNYGITDLDTTSEDYPLTNPFNEAVGATDSSGYCIHFGHNILARYYGAGTTTVIYKANPGVDIDYGEYKNKDESVLKVLSELNGSTFKNDETPAQIVREATGSIYDNKVTKDWKDVRKEANSNKLQSNDQLGSDDVNSWDKYVLESMGTFKVNSKETVEWNIVDEVLDIDPNNVKITWGSKVGTSGTFNVGYAYYLNSINDKTDVSGVAQKITTASKKKDNVTYNMNGQIITSDCTKLFDNFLANADDIPNYDWALDNLINTWDMNSDHKNTKKVSKKDKSTGISVNVMSVPKEVNSYKVVLRYDADKEKIVKKTKKEVSYYTNEFENFTSSKNTCYVAVVPNDSKNKYSEKNLKNLVKHLETANNGNILSKFRGWFSTDYAILDSCHGGDTVSLGAKLNQNENNGKGASYGYSVYFLEVVGDLSVSGEVVLQDYELNYVYEDLVAHVTGLKNYAIIYKDLWTLDPKSNLINKTEVNCDNTKEPHTFYKFDKDLAKDFRITLLDKSKVKDDGKTVINDDSLIKKENWGTTLLLYNKDLGILANRETLKNGFNIDTSTINAREDAEGNNKDIDFYTVSYAYNLTRSSFGDNRTLSSINKNNLDTNIKDYATNVLMMDVGNKPAHVLKTIESKRSSSSKITGSFKEVVKWDAVYTLTNDKTKTTAKSLIHTCEEDNGHKNVLEYTDLVETKDSLKAFNVNGLPSRTFAVNLTEIGYKYLTEPKDIGKNSSVTTDKLIDTRKTATSEVGGTLSEDSYRFAYVKLHNDNEGANSIKLKYYPEVKMRSYRYIGDTIDSRDSVMAEDLYTLGEELRTSSSSSMYIYKINKATGKGDITGKVYSDGFAVGTGASSLDTSKPVIYAGSDVTLNADCNFTINMYGYSLDLVNKDDNLIGSSYTSIVADNSDIYTDWGNDTNLNKVKLLKQYKDWVTEMTKLENYSADVTLDVKGGGVNKTYNNFSTTLGKITKPVSSETGAYNLEIRNGELDKATEGYKALIAQIMADYGYAENQKADAEALFEKSGLYTAIINAIEHSNGDDNKSQVGAETLGSNNHWYDEEVRTIVIRRFETDPVTVSGVVLQDKIDYGAAPSSKGLDSQNSNGSFTDKAEGKWYLTLYFKNLPVSLSDSTIYKPDDMTVKESAIDTLDVITNNVHIDGADFLIPNATTSDMNR